MEPDQVVIVTGPSRGIGCAIAGGLADAGLTVIVDHHRREAGAGDVVAGIEAAGGKASTVRANVADPAAVAVLFETAAKLGPRHCTVTSAEVMKTAVRRPDQRRPRRHARRQLQGNPLRRP